MQGSNPSNEGIGVGANGHMSLHPWEEISGTLKDIRKDDDTITVVLSTGKLVFGKDLIEGTTPTQQLKSEIGSHVSILRSGTGDKSVHIKVDSSESTNE